MSRLLSRAFWLLTAAAPVYAFGIEAHDFAIFAGNDLEMDNFSRVAGSVYARDDVRLTDTDIGSGDVYAGDDVHLVNGEVSGDLVNNGVAHVDEASDVSGNRVSGPGSAPLVDSPHMPAFEAGVGDVLHSDESTDLYLSPGRYGDVRVSGFGNKISLTSGDYYVESIAVLDFVNLELTIVDGEPIRLFSEHDIYLGGSDDLFVNGVDIDPYSTPQPTRELASKVLFASRGDIDLGESFFTPLLGTLWAGDDIVGGGELFGSVIAGGNILVECLHVEEHVPPEPGLLSLSTSSGDYDGDGLVNGSDHNVWASSFGSTSELQADGNGNGVIDAGDYTMWRDAISASATAVPESAAGALAACAAIGSVLTKKRRPLT